MKPNQANRNIEKKLNIIRRDVTPNVCKRKDFDTHSYFYFTEITKEKL